MQLARKKPEPIPEPGDGAEILIENLSVRFPDREGGETIDALVNVNLANRQGEFVSLVGPRAAARPRFAAIADLQRPSEGAITVRGRRPARCACKEVRHRIPEPGALRLAHRPAQRMHADELMGLPKAQRTATVSEMLGMVGLYDFGRKYPGQLSGGMQQRVGIARALAIDPEILLMDEPFSALDEFTKEKLNEDLLTIWSKTHKTVVFVTHNIAEAVFLSDRVVVLSPHPGRVSAVVDIEIPGPGAWPSRIRPPSARWSPRSAAASRGLIL